MMNTAFEEEGTLKTRNPVSAVSSLSDIESNAPPAAESAGSIRITTDQMGAAFIGGGAMLHYQPMGMGPYGQPIGIAGYGRRWAPSYRDAVLGAMSAGDMLMYGYPSTMTVDDERPVPEEPIEVDLRAMGVRISTLAQRAQSLLQTTRTLTSVSLGPNHAKYNAVQFIAALPNWVAQPHVFFGEEGDVVLEWKSNDARVLVTFEGDDSYGYAIKIGRRFVPGGTPVSQPNEVPQDLLTYLHEHFRIDDAGK